MKVVRFRWMKIHPRGEFTHGSAGSSGWDLCAAIDGPMTLLPGERRVVPTGIILDLNPGWEGMIRPRSGLASRSGATVLNAPGTIDCDYRGEVKVVLINLDTDNDLTIMPGERIAQLVVREAPQMQPVQVDSVGWTARGDRGFGSTGE